MSTATTPSDRSVVLVTGASRGIGLAAVEFLLGATPSPTIEGPFNVVTLSRSLPEPLARLQREHGERLICVQGDVLDESVHKSLVEKAVAKWGRLDSCILNAGVLNIGRVGAPSSSSNARSEPPASCAQQIAVNLSSLFTTLHHTLPHIRESPTGLGRVVITSSGAAVGNYAGWAMYNAAKAGANALARTVANEEKGKVAVWAVRPGVVDTEMIGMICNKGLELGMDDAAIKKFHGLRDEGKLLDARDPAHVLAALAVRGTLDEPKTKDGKGAGGAGEFVSFDEEQMSQYWWAERVKKQGGK